MIKKIIAVFIAIVIVFGTIPIDVFANNSQEPAKFEDMPENWSRTALENAVENGLLSGVDGKIMPNEKLTRAQMATVITRAFGAKDKGNISKFSDVKASDWFYDSMSKAYKMGVIKGSNNKLNPKEPITRQEAFVMIARAFKLESADVLNKSFEDTDQISDWAKEEVYSVINNEYIQGSNGKINPKGNITRAEFAQVFYNIVKEYIQTEGTYKNLVKGNIMVSVPNVILKDLTIEGDLIIGDGVGEGDVILDSVKVRGRIVVRGGGENSIIIKGNSDISNIIVAKVDGVVSIKVQGDANVEIIYIDDESDDVNIEGQIGNLQLMASGIIVGAIDSQIKTIDIIGKNSKVIIDKDSKVENININKEAVGIKLEVVGIADKVTTQAPNTQITGKGKVSKVEVKEGGNNAKIETTNTKIQVDKGVTGVTLPPTPPSPSSSGGSSSGGSSSGGSSSGGSSSGGSSSGGTTVVSVSAITITGEAKVGGTLTATPTPSGATGTYQWQYNPKDGTWYDCEGATGNTYVLKDKDAGKLIRVIFTASGNYTGTKTSAEVGPVKPATAEEIKVSAISVTGTGGATTITTDNGELQMLAAVEPADATNKAVTWSVENGTGSATISATGLLTAVANGTVKVTAKAKDGSGKSGFANIEISGQEPPAYASTKALTNATVTVANGTSEDDAIAALDTTVKVVGTKGETGTATIVWTIESYKGSILGEYPATGVLTLPTDWTGTAGNVTATVRVTKANVPSSVTVGSSTLNSTNPYLVGGVAATAGTLGVGNCTAHFDSLTGVLSLQDYVGGGIRIDEAGKDLRIKLIGNANKITGGQFGIHNDKGDIYITSDNEALLKIEIKSSSDGAAIVTGWQGFGTGSVFIGGEVKLTIEGQYNGAQNNQKVTGIYAGKGSVIIQEQAEYFATITNSKNQGRGIFSNGKTTIKTSGNIEIDVSKSLQGIGIYGMDGIEIQQVNSMLITIPSTGEDTNTKFTSGTVNVSSGVAVNKSTTKASYRSGTPYTLGLVGGKITTATGDVIGSPHQYLEGDEITIESTISEFDRWTKANGGVLETTLFTGGTTANTPTATIKMPAVSLSIKAREKETGTVIDIAAIPGVVAPVTGKTPVTIITDTVQYTGTVTWSDSPVTFAAETVYTATITLKAKPEFKLDGVTANFFTVAGATASNAADSGEIIAVFPATEADTLITIAEIPGVVAPVTGKIPVTKITDTDQYTGTVAWTPANNPFAAETVYTATIKLTAKTGFTLDGVIANFFTVNGIATTHVAGVVTVEFPATAPFGFAGGTGTLGDPYKVATAEQLNKVREYMGSGIYFKQTANIDLSDYLAVGGAGYNEGKGWVPIGSSESSPFKGTYDGDSKDITGLFINRPEADYQGLFGYGGQHTNLKNINLLEVNIKGKSFVGGLIGYFGFGQLENCHVSGEVEGTGDFVGGLAGLYNNSDVGKGMKNCSTSVEVIGNKYVGGLAGSSGYTTIDSCYSSGSVTGVDIVGGLVGSVDSNSNVKVTNSYSLASVTATTTYGRVGGLVGLNWKAIENCYAAGQVTGKATTVGGLVGQNLGTLTTITSSYYDKETTGQTDTGKGDGKTTVDMMKKTTFSGWDFETIWNITDGSYPTLK